MASSCWGDGLLLLSWHQTLGAVKGGQTERAEDVSRTIAYKKKREHSKRTKGERGKMDGRGGAREGRWQEMRQNSNVRGGASDTWSVIRGDMRSGLASRSPLKGRAASLQRQTLFERHDGRETLMWAIKMSLFHNGTQVIYLYFHIHSPHEIHTFCWD